MKPRLYSATGNILWVVEAEEVDAKKLCQAGQADGVMLVNPDLELRIVNADGSEGGFCGNGVRAVAFYLQETRGLHQAKLKMGGHEIHVIMEGSHITMTLASPAVKIASQGEGYFLTIPNPHWVFLNPPASWTLEQEAAQFCKARNTNVEFIYPGKDHIRVLVYERGVGPTAACGSGAMAVFKVSQSLGLIKNSACIRMPGGDLTVSEEAGSL